MIKTILDTISLWLVPLIILIILFSGIIKKMPVYELFVDGAKDGVKIGFNIFPYLLAIIVAISMLRASGFVEFLTNGLNGIFTAINVPVDVFPIMIFRSLSGSAILGVLEDIVSNNDVTSFTSRLAAIMVGSSETTFYVLTVYFGSVGIKKYRYALWVGILADIVGILTAIFVAYWFFA